MMPHYLFDEKYRRAEADRYERIVNERRNGRRAGCLECNRRDAPHSVGICRFCARKLESELRYLGIAAPALTPEPRE